MNCSEIKSNFLYYAEGNLPYDKIQKIEAHLSKCVECSALYNEVKITYTIFDNQIHPGLSADLTSTIENKIQKHHIQVNFERYTLNSFFSRIAATILIVIGIALGILVGGKTTNSASIQYNGSYNDEIETIAGEYFLNENGQSLEAFLTNE